MTDNRKKIIQSKSLPQPSIISNIIPISKQPSLLPLRKSSSPNNQIVITDSSPPDTKVSTSTIPSIPSSIAHQQNQELYYQASDAEALSSVSKKSSKSWKSSQRSSISNQHSSKVMKQTDMHPHQQKKSCMHCRSTIIVFLNNNTEKFKQ